MDNLLIESETKKGGYFFKWVPGIIICGFGCFCIYKGFEDVYPQLIPIVLGLFMLIISFVLIYTNDPIDRLEIYMDRLEVKSLFGRMKQTIYLNEITSWTEVEKSAKSKTWLELTIYASGKKISLSSNVYKNYESIKDALVRDKERDSELEIQLSKKKAKQLGFVFLAAGVFFLCGFYYQYSNKEKEVKAADLTRLEQVVTSEIKINKGSKGSRSIRLELKDYPDFDFKIENTAYKATAAEDFVDNVKTGDTIFVDIATNEYQMKLTKEKELGFFDKTIDYRTLSVYGLRDKKNQVYLTVDGFNESNRSNGNFRFWFAGIIGIIGVIAGLFLLRRSA